MNQFALPVKGDYIKTFDMKWISTALFIFAGTSVALKASWISIAFPCFVIGHAILVYYFIIHHKSKPLILQNVYFLIMNIIATYIWNFNT